MEYVVLLIAILGLALLVIALGILAMNIGKKNTSFKKNNNSNSTKLTKEKKKKLKNKFRKGRPNSIQPIKTVQKYDYPEATRRLKERIEERINEEPEIKTGKRGGRYTKDTTKDGRPYRRYF